MYKANNVYFHKDLTMFKVKDYKNHQFFDAWSKKIRVDYLKPSNRLNDNDDLLASTLILTSAVDIIGTFLFSSLQKIEVKERMFKVLNLVLNNSGYGKADKEIICEFFYTNLRSGVVHGGSTLLFEAHQPENYKYKNIRALIFVPENEMDPRSKAFYLNSNNGKIQNIWFNPKVFYKDLDTAFVDYCSNLNKEVKNQIGGEIKKFYFCNEDIKEPSNEDK